MNRGGNMIKVEVTLKSLGDITQLPDSQKIFGGLMSMYSKEYGDDMTTEFVKEVYNREAKLMVSSLFPKGYLPLPKEYILSLMNQFYKTDKNSKELYENLKSFKYISENKLLNFLSKTLKEKNGNIISDTIETFLEEIKDDYIEIKYYPQQRAGIANEIDGIPFVETNLYSTPKINVIYKGQNCSEFKEKEYMFWIIADDEQISERMEAFFSVVEKGCDNGELMILGRRATQGSNIYNLNKYKSEKMQDKKSEYYINLGKMIPNEIDYKKSYLDLFTSERRPYNNYLIQDKRWNDKCFISFIREGSIICKPDGISIFSVSKSIENLFNDDTIIFGNSLLYKI